MRKPTNAGLTDEQATKVLDILSRSGMVAESRVLAIVLNINHHRLVSFLKTKQAKLAAARATNLSQKLYLAELRKDAFPDDEDQETASTSTLSEQEALSLGLSIKDRKNMGCHSPDVKTESDWIKDKDPSMTDAEIAKWNRLADGK